MGTVWFDLKAFGLQSLQIPPQTTSMPERGGGLVDEVFLDLSICEPLAVRREIASVPACSDPAELDRQIALLYNESDPQHSVPIGLVATSREDRDGNQVCIVASIGSWQEMDKQLLDPLYPTQGVQLEFGGGSACDEPDDFVLALRAQA